MYDDTRARMQQVRLDAGQEAAALRRSRERWQRQADWYAGRGMPKLAKRARKEVADIDRVLMQAGA